MEVNKFNPNRLRQARVFRGLTISELADLINTTKQAISQYEQGKISPKVEVLFNIVNALKFPREFFYVSDHISGYNSVTFFRARANVSKKTLNAHDQVIELLFRAQQFLEQYIEFPKLNIPEPPVRETWEKEEIEYLAKEVRTMWGTGGEPIHNIIFELEKNGIFVATAPTNSQNIDAYSKKKVIHGNDYHFIILAKNNKSAVRKQFDAAHELGHLLMHSWIDENVDVGADDKRKMEKEANYFASSLLLPKKEFVASIYKTKLDEYIQLKKYWMVSINAMIVRSYHLNIINYTQYQYLQKQISKRKMRSKEPFDDLLKISQPGMFKQAVKELLSDGTITPRKMVKELKMFPNLIEEILNLDAETLRVDEEKKNTLEFRRKTKV